MDIGSTAAVVLAAGASSRFGSNKLLLPFGDQMVIARVAQSVIASGVGNVVVVTGHERERVRDALATLPLTFAHNPDFALGEMTSSLKVGLRALASSDSRAAFVVLGDMPLVSSDTLARIAEAWAPDECDIVAPTFNGERGQPVLFARSLWGELLRLKNNSPPREVVARHRDRLRLLDVGSDEIFLDVDTPGKYRAALARLRP